MCRSTSQGSFRQDNQDLQDKQKGFLDKIDKIVRSEVKKNCRRQSISLGGASSVRTQILDFKGTRRH
jgi:hypothetical protein